MINMLCKKNCNATVLSVVQIWQVFIVSAFNYKLGIYVQTKKWISDIAILTISQSIILSLFIFFGGGGVGGCDKTYIFCMKCLKFDTIGRKF